MNRTLFTPFYLDQPLPGLEPVVAPDWHTNAPTLPPGGSAQERMLALYRPLAEQVAEAVGDGERPVSFAGDCCATVAVVAGLARAGLEPTLLWLDAHGDFNTWETTPSSFLGGMPLAMLAGHGEQSFLEGLGLTPILEERIVLADGRDLDPGERTALEASRVRHHPNFEALLAAPLPAGPIYLHFDVDVLDPRDLPAVNYPAPGGPAPAVVRRLFAKLAASGRLAAASLSAWNPGLDPDGRSGELVMGLLAELLA